MGADAPLPKPGTGTGTQRVLILGATSAIARALAAEFAARGQGLVLAARDAAEMGAVASDLSLRYGVPVDFVEFDALAYQTHAAMLETCWRRAGGAIGGAALCVGELGDQRRAEADAAEARRLLEVNLVAGVSLLGDLANRLEERGGGFLCVLSSVAGERGRQSNYLYGAAKAGLTTYAQGLRNRLHRSGVHVLTVLPGFVDTRMTYGKPGMFLVAPPRRVARDVVRALERRRDVLYTPAFWRYVMLGIRAIPERLFKRLSL